VEVQITPTVFLRFFFLVRWKLRCKSLGQLFPPPHILFQHPINSGIYFPKHNNSWNFFSENQMSSSFTENTLRKVCDWGGRRIGVQLPITHFCFFFFTLFIHIPIYHWNRNSDKKHEQFLSGFCQTIIDHMYIVEYLIFLLQHRLIFNLLNPSLHLF